MATYFIDYDGGNNANNGTTFALRKKTYSGLAPVAGDEIRFAKSPDPTSVGNGSWTGGGRLNPVTISSSTNATPIVITTSSAHGLVANDYVSIVSHTTNTNANGIWKVGTVASSTQFQILNMDGSNTTGNGVGSAGNATKINNCIVKLATPVTQNVALCGGLNEKPNWTQATNVTTSVNTTNYREGYSSQSIAIGAAFTTGVAAYYNFPTSINLSGYQQLCVWVRQTAGTVAVAGDISITLCSGTDGTSPQNTFNIPALIGLNVWYPVVVDLATNLHNSIASIAFNVNTDRAAQTFLIDNIVASKSSSSADSLTHASLISKSNGSSSSDEPWFSIQSINYDAIMIANTSALSSTETGIRGYSNGATETVTTYKRETTKAPGSHSIDLPTGGTTSLVTYSGGWDTSTSMTTQTGETWYDNLSGTSYSGVVCQNTSNLRFDKLNFCRYINGIYIVGNVSGLEIGKCFVTANTTGVNLICNYGNIEKIISNNNTNNISISSAYGAILGTLNAISGNNYNFSLNRVRFTNATQLNSYNQRTSSGDILDSLNFSIGSYNYGDSANYTTAIDLRRSSGIYVNGGTLGGSAGVTSSILNLNNVSITVASEVPMTVDTIGTVFSNRHDNTDNNSWIWQPYGTINQQSSVVDSPATTSWKMSPSTSPTSANNPLYLKLATIVCGANSLVTITARMRRDNTGLTMRLICPGGQISGVSNDVSSDMTEAINTWQTVTITFTPTKAGGVDIYAYAFGGTTFNGYVCNVNASQA